MRTGANSAAYITVEEMKQLLASDSQNRYNVRILFLITLSSQDDISGLLLKTGTQSLYAQLLKLIPV